MADPDPLAEIEFFARSPNRIEVLSALADDELTRQELADAIDVSQPTLGRILRDLADRRWIETVGERYRATATGRLVEAGITDLHRRLETETRLREIGEWLPTDAIDVDLERFDDATITTPSRTRPNAPIRRMLDLLGSTDRALLLSHSFNEEKLDLIHERTVAGELTTRGVFGQAAIDAVTRQPDLCAKLREIIETERAEIRVHEGDVPLAVEVTDDRTHLLLRDDEGIVRAALDTDDGAVRDWAERLHARYWERSRPIDPGALDCS